MSTLQVAELTGLIFLAALLYSSVGHAGASGYLAAMALFSVAPVVMKPAALTLNILVALIGTVQFARAGCFSWHIFWPFAVASVPCAFLGGRVQLPVEAYRPVVGVVLLFAAIRLLMHTRAAAAARVRLPALPVMLGTGAVIGFLSGLTGVGGGIFLTPLLLLMGWAETRQAAGVSVPFILVNSLSGMAGLLTHGVKLPAGIALWALAAAGGGLIGSHFGSRKFAGTTLRRVLAVVLVIAGLKLIFAK